MSEIETDLLKIAKGVKAKKDEDRQGYLKRLAEKVNEAVDANDTIWDDLSMEGQNWVNAATIAIGKSKDIAEFSDADEEEEADDGEEEEADDGEEEEADDGEEEADSAAETGDDETAGDDDEAEEDELPVKKKTTAKAKVEKKAKAEKPKVEKKAKVAKPKPEKKASAKGSGIKIRIKKLLIKKPSMSIEDLMTKLTAEGGTPSKMTVGGIRAEFRHTLNFLNDEGLLNIEL